MGLGTIRRWVAALGLLGCAGMAAAGEAVFGDGRGSGPAFTQAPLEEVAGALAASTGPKSIVCGLFISGTWLYQLEPNATGGPRAYVYGAASPNDLRIVNTALSCFPQTGTLRFEYWVAANGQQPIVNGGAFFGTRIAVFPNIGQLFQGQNFININYNALYTPPPYGTYWLVLYLAQYQPGMCASADGFCYNDSYTSAQMITLGNSTLSVSKNGTGLGTVTGVLNAPSPVSVINCGATCQASVYGGYTVTLSAAAAGGSTFAGWSGGGCSGTNASCTVPMTVAQSVSATFNVATPPQTYTLNVSKSGFGTVTSSPAGIDCGATCGAVFAAGTGVSLTATPALGYNFTGWTLDCAGTGTCNVTMNGNRNVTALFAALPTVPIPTAQTDFNDDGRSDLLYRNAATGQVYRMLMNGFSITHAAMAYTEPNTAWRIVQDADLNGDGIADLLYRNTSTGQVFYQPFNLSGMPSGGAVIATEPNAAWKIVHMPDLNGDGKSDLLWWNSLTGQVYAMVMNGASIAAQGLVYTEPNTAWRIAAVGDFAGSGKKNQLVWRNSATGQVFLMTVTVSGNAFSRSGAMIYSEPNLAWKILGAADFDGNGKSDLLWRNEATGQVYVMLMNGGAIASAGIVYTEPNLAWKIVAQGDYNGDGKADLLWRHDATGQVFMMRMNGLAIAASAMVYTEPNAQWRLLGPWEYAQ